MFCPKTIIAAFCLAALPAAADDVTDAINNALQAYEEGDTSYAADELNFALQLLDEMKADTLTGFLPEALEGWTRTVDEEFVAGMGMMGGGVGAKADYVGASDRFSITLMADNQMVLSMSPMLNNTALVAAQGGKMVRVGREKFVNLNGQLMGIVGNRVLVQTEGDNEDAIIQHLETLDFRALPNFDS